MPGIDIPSTRERPSLRGLGATGAHSAWEVCRRAWRPALLHHDRSHYSWVHRTAALAGAGPVAAGFADVVGGNM